MANVSLDAGPLDFDSEGNFTTPFATAVARNTVSPYVVVPPTR